MTGDRKITLFEGGALGVMGMSFQFLFKSSHCHDPSLSSGGGLVLEPCMGEDDHAKKQGWSLPAVELLSHRELNSLETVKTPERIEGAGLAFNQVSKHRQVFFQVLHSGTHLSWR